MTPKDVLSTWWENSKIATYEFSVGHSDNYVCIRCKRCQVSWITNKSEQPWFEYATDLNGEIQKVMLADPEVFLKLVSVLELVKNKHDTRYAD